MGEFVFLGILMALSGGAFASSFFFQQSKYDMSGGPGLFPKYIAAALFVCCLIKVIQLLRSKSYKGKSFAFLELFRGSCGVFLVSAWCYVLLLNFLGFAISSAVYLVLIIHYLLHKSKHPLGGWKRILPRSLGIVAAVLVIQFLFIDTFKIMLPVGIFFS